MVLTPPRTPVLAPGDRRARASPCRSARLHAEVQPEAFHRCATGIIAGPGRGPPSSRGRAAKVRQPLGGTMRARPGTESARGAGNPFDARSVGFATLLIRDGAHLCCRRAGRARGRWPFARRMPRALRRGGAVAGFPAAARNPVTGGDRGSSMPPFSTGLASPRSRRTRSSARLGGRASSDVARENRRARYSMTDSPATRTAGWFAPPDAFRAGRPGPGGSAVTGSVDKPHETPQLVPPPLDPGPHFGRNRYARRRSSNRPPRQRTINQVSSGPITRFWSSYGHVRDLPPKGRVGRPASTISR